MAVQSAGDLVTLINTLQGQFGGHHQTTSDLRTQAQSHIQHVQDEAGTWITNEIQTLINDWQNYMNQLMQIESWFQHHIQNLPKIAQQVSTLASETL